MSVLEINGERVGRERVHQEVALLRQEFGPAVGLEAEMRLAAEAEQIVIDRVLMDQEALRLGLAVTEAAVRQALAELTPRSDGVAGCRAGAATPELRAEVERRLRIDGLLQHWFAALRPPRLEELRNYYKRNSQAFHGPEMVHVSHIVKNVAEGEDPSPPAEAMELVRDLLLAGHDFTAVARRYSDCPEQAGDLGHFQRGIMVEEFDAIVFSVRVGKLTDVFRTRFGFHIALVHEHKLEGIRSFDEVRPEIELALHRKKQDRELGARLAALRGRAVIRKVPLAS